MTTRREVYLDALVALVKEIPNFPAVVDRSVIAAFTIEDDDVVVIHRGKEDPDHGMLGVVDRTCEILVSVITRNTVPERQADGLMELLHPLIMNFAAAGVIDVSDGVSEAPKYSGTDGSICMITTHYFLQYRTASGSLST